MVFVPEDKYYDNNMFVPEYKDCLFRMSKISNLLRRTSSKLKGSTSLDWLILIPKADNDTTWDAPDDEGDGNTTLNSTPNRD